jgi:hypothetical protein
MPERRWWGEGVERLDRWRKQTTEELLVELGPTLDRLAAAKA